MIRYLSKSKIIIINKETIEVHGGNFMPPSNFLHEENLDYLVEVDTSEMFGQQLYPLITDKAAVYCFNIICNHIFSDGNKRTGLGAALQFLNLNGLDISQNITDDILTEFILKLASGQFSLEECKAWFAENTSSLK
ncbi:MAG: type II toxin-antitoxin system death-on-curing family toxin [Leadbetterella sp.]|nr:type II toxin-antitoxin system death-on-curing family toxin [Leadbetterella sp.]